MQRNFQTINLKEKRVSVHYFILDEQCIYSAYSTRKAIKYLKCISCNCKGKLSIDIFERTNANVDHNHQNHQHQADYEIAFEKLRQTVRESQQPVRDLHKQALRHLSEQASGFLAWKNCRQTLERIRYEEMPRCRSLVQLEELLEDDEGIVFKSFGFLRQTRFYQASVEGNLVFANLELIRELPERLEICLDGTFNVIPFHSRQLLVMMCELRGKPRPVVYVVMNSQRTVAYKSVLQFIKDGILSFDGTERSPVSAITDFEQSIRRALIQVWPQINRAGCNFHFCQSIRRKALSMDRISKYMTGVNIRHRVVKYFMRISFLPLDRIDAGYAAILDFINANNLNNIFERFIDYFHNTWLVRYPREDWCVSERNRRTNNNLEGYNNTIKHSIPINPSLWVFLDRLLDLAYEASSSYYSDVMRNAPPPKDHSKITVPLRIALRRLRAGAINELEFLDSLVFL